MIIDVPAPVSRTRAHEESRAVAPAVARPRRVVLTVCCAVYLVAIVTVWLVMRQAGDRSFAATVMLMGPRWPYALPLVLLWPWAVWRRRWLPLVLAAAATWVAAFQVIGVRASLWDRGGRGDLRLLTCNVHRSQLDGAGLMRFIEEAQPDIVALQGWSDVHKDLFREPAWNTRREGELFVAVRASSAIAGARPVVLAEPDEVPPGERGAGAVFEVDTARGRVTLLNLHLASPHAGLNAMGVDSGAKLKASVARRWKETETARAVAESIRGPLLIAGDFNTVDDSPMFRRYWGEFADAFLVRGWGPGYTYLNTHTQLRIDHVLAGQEWEIVGWSLGPDVGSPHRPLVADVVSK